MVRIEGFDLCPCGGTHVDSTGELEGMKIVHRESKGSGVDRVEFELD
jgi:misacylated tRNA(Ala) deacylase